MTRSKCLCIFLLTITTLPTDLFGQTFSWTRGVGIFGTHAIEAVAPLTNGDLLYSGTFEDSLAITNDTLVANGQEEAFLMRTDSAGNPLWVIGEGGAGRDEGGGVASDASGNLYMAGTFTEPAVIAGTSFPGTMGGHYFFAKYDATGNPQWVLDTRIGVSDEPLPVERTANGDMLIAGTYRISATFGATTFNSPFLGTFLARVNPSGTVLWARNLYLEGLTGNLRLDAMTQDQQGNILLSGHYSGGLVKTAGDTLWSTGNEDQFVARYSDTGSLLWAETVGACTGNTVCKATAGPPGQVFFAGSFTDTLFLGTDTLISPILGNTNGVIARMNLTGGILSYTQLISPGQVDITNLRTDTATGGAYLMGTYRGFMDLDTFSLVDNFPGHLNMFLADVRGNGAIEWVVQAGHTPEGSVLPHALRPDGKGGLLLGGQAARFATFGNDTLSAITSDQLFMSRLIDWPVLGTDTVWPGDANDDTHANNRDILALGLGYGTMGPVRPNASLTWVGQAAPIWADTLPNGVSLVHTDTDGDGIVGLSDTLAIDLNFGRTHQKRAEAAEMLTGGMNLEIEFSQDTVDLSDTVNAIIKLGKPAQQAQDIYGVAFDFNYDLATFDTSYVMVSYGQSWLGNKDVTMATGEKNFGAQGVVPIGLSRITHTNKTGDGEICRVTIVMVDDIAGKRHMGGKDTATAWLSNILVINAKGDSIPTGGIRDSMLLLNAGDGPGEEPKPLQLLIYPNPSEGVFTVEILNGHLDGMRLRDVTGREVREHLTRFSKAYIDGRRLPKGVYFLELFLGDQRYTHKLVLK